MIDHKHKFIFIHIPRTGGSSIESQFDYIEGEGREKNKHWNIFDWEDHLSKETLGKYFKFSFVRNPWDLIISKYTSNWYNNRKRGMKIGKHMGKSLNFFLSNYKPAPWEHGDSFFDYIDPKQLDFIGRFENRTNDLNYVSKKINVELNTATHERKSKRSKCYTEYYNNETRNIVADRYARDIEYFGYKFGE